MESYVRKMVRMFVEVRPTIEALADRLFQDYRTGALRDTLVAAELDLGRIMSEMPAKEAVLCRPFPEPTDPGAMLTAQEFLVRWLNVNPACLKQNSVASGRIAVVLKTCERALKSHINRTALLGDSVLECAAAYKLRLTGVVSKSSKGHLDRRPQTKDECVFACHTWEDELSAAEVPSFARRVDEMAAVYKKYLALPDIVKALFFSETPLRASQSSAKDLPFALCRDFLLQVDNQTWDELQILNFFGNKSTYNLVACEQIKRFVQYERAENGLLLGEGDDDSLARGKMPRLSQKENALLQLTKPQKWVKRLQKAVE